MPRKQYTPEEKLKIVLEALKEERLIADIASDYGGPFRRDPSLEKRIAGKR